MEVEGEEVREIKETAGAASGVGFAAVQLFFSGGRARRLVFDVV